MLVVEIIRNKSKGKENSPMKLEEFGKLAVSKKDTRVSKSISTEAVLIV